MSRARREQERWERMALHEVRLRAAGYERIAGVDEVGRGPLAGPVLAAAVVLGEQPIPGLNDSKKLSPRRREQLFEEILDRAQDWAVAQVDVSEIERLNILEATKKAMKLALAGLERVDFVLVDQLTLPGLVTPQEAITGGDRLVNAIAAASILAKVVRDRLLQLYDKDYPQYGFASHKGYGTPAHLEALRKHGPCPLHRRSFLSRIVP